MKITRTISLSFDGRGTSVLELIIVIGIFGVLITAIAAFQIFIFKYQKIYEIQTKSDQEIIMFTRVFTKDARTAQQSASGSYPITEATDAEFSFYSDVDNDGVAEQMRYAIVGNSLQRGIIEPSGSPLTYNPANEVTTNMITSVDSTATYFRYYSASYNGVTSTTPLIQPVDLALIQHVGVTITIPSTRPELAPLTASTHVTIRNLR